MELTKKQIYYGLGGVAVLGVGYWLWKKNEDNKAQLAQAQQQTENAKAMLVKQAEEAQTAQEGDGAPDAYGGGDSGGGGGMSGGMYQPPIAVVIPDSIHDLIPPTTPTTPAATTPSTATTTANTQSGNLSNLITNMTPPSTSVQASPTLVGVAGSPAASGTTTTTPTATRGQGAGLGNVGGNLAGILGMTGGSRTTNTPTPPIVHPTRTVLGGVRRR